MYAKIRDKEPISSYTITRLSMRNPIEIIAESLFSHAFVQIKFANTFRKFE